MGGQLQDHAAINALAAQLTALMPALRHEWAAIRVQRSGPAKRFAEFLVLAKVPGISPDLAGYTRPQGSIRAWQGGCEAPEWPITFAPQHPRVAGRVVRLGDRAAGATCRLGRAACSEWP